MSVEHEDAVVQMQALRSLREFYPIKVDEIVLISSVQKVLKEVSIDKVTQALKVLKENGWIEETVVKAPFGKTETYRYKVTSDGIDHLQSLEEKTAVKDVVSAKEIETRLIETYDRIKTDMDEMRTGIENNQRSLVVEMDGMRKRITDHDQVIKTYFLRVIETFGVFVSIFAVVVVLILTLGFSIGKASNADYWLLIIAVPLSVVLYVVVMLWGIKRFILV